MNTASETKGRRASFGIGVGTLVALAVLGLFLSAAVSRSNAQEGRSGSALLSRGRFVYESNCAVCHGIGGGGDGPAAHMFIVRPRDFRPGIYKFRSTPSGSLPTDEDLLRVVARGLRWTGMLGRADLSLADRKAVVGYIKTFSSRFETERPRAPVVVPKAPIKTDEVVTRGKTLYREADCVSCHGDRGRGDGVSAKRLQDDWGWPTRPSDLTWRPLKRGSDLEASYLALATGISGTPMPSYVGSLAGDEIWALVYYLESIVPLQQRLSPEQLLGEEQQGRMALHMGSMMGRGMMGHGMMR